MTSRRICLTTENKFRLTSFWMTGPSKCLLCSSLLIRIDDSGSPFFFFVPSALSENAKNSFLLPILCWHQAKPIVADLLLISVLANPRSDHLLANRSWSEDFRTCSCSRFSCQLLTFQLWTNATETRVSSTGRIPPPPPKLCTSNVLRATLLCVVVHSLFRQIGSLFHPSLRPPP